MTDKDKKRMHKAKYRRRVEAVRAQYGLMDWSEDSMGRFLRRLLNIVGDEITDPDLAVLVRLYNRELIGRSRS